MNDVYDGAALLKRRATIPGAQKRLRKDQMHNSSWRMAAWAAHGDVARM